MTYTDNPQKKYKWSINIQKVHKIFSHQENVNKNTLGFLLTSVRMAITKKTENECWQECGEKNPCTVLLRT